MIAGSFGPNIPEDMFHHIMADIPPTMHAAMRMLADTLHMEAMHGHNMRAFGEL